MTTADAITELMSKASIQIFGNLPEEIRILGFKRTTDKPDANAADIIKFPIKTVSEANQRGSWRPRHARKVKQQSDFVALWRGSKAKVVTPATITFTRFSTNVLDSDNLAGAFKHVRDALAKEIGIDDGSPLITWRYKQERISKREHYFTLTIQSSPSETQ